MTMTLSNVTIPPFVITDEGQALAKSAADFIARSDRSKTDTDGTISVDAQKLVEMLQSLANGKLVAALSTHSELTLEQAADVLGLPEHDLLALLDAGEIESRRVGNRRMVIAGSLFDYDQETTRLQNEALDELTLEAQEQGFY